MYEVLLSHEAEKFYKRQPPEIKLKVNRCMDNLSTSPLFGPHIRKLHGSLAGKHRFALGDLRVIYRVDRAHNSVEVFAIGFRGDIYK
jgi:mRNA-degrading endonuclease RelE of RelBE toxin-antitoxin system